jgi:hypothetical protein
VNSCRFSGAGIGIRWNGLPNFMGVYGSRFDNLTTAIANTVGAGAKTNSWHRYLGNWFHSNTNGLVVPLQNSLVIENVFGAFTTLSCDLVGGGGGCIVTKNYLSGTYSVAGGYRVSGASDEWAGNFNTLAGSLTVSDPA